VVTLGGRGAAVVDQVESTWRTSWLPPYPVQPIDTVGAGDAFCGALAARLARGDSLLQAAWYAGAAGALATTKSGSAPAMPYEEEVKTLVKSISPTIDVRSVRNESPGATDIPARPIA
jgi:ribokinase